MNTDQIDTIHGYLPAASPVMPLSVAPFSVKRSQVGPMGLATARHLAPMPMGEDRLVFGGFGSDAAGGDFAAGTNGITITGLEAHAAVRMHVTPATGAFWSSDHKCPKRMATPSSAGRLRTS